MAVLESLMTSTCPRQLTSAQPTQYTARAVNAGQAGLPWECQDVRRGGAALAGLGSALARPVDDRGEYSRAVSISMGPPAAGSGARIRLSLLVSNLIFPASATRRRASPKAH